jgi:hypothetical protein
MHLCEPFVGRIRVDLNCLFSSNSERMRSSLLFEFGELVENFETPNRDGTCTNQFADIKLLRMTAEGGEITLFEMPRQEELFWEFFGDQR